METEKKPVGRPRKYGPPKDPNRPKGHPGRPRKYGPPKDPNRPRGRPPKNAKTEIKEVTKPRQCNSLRLPDDSSSVCRVLRLMYTKSGDGILALAGNAVHKFWRWKINACNATGQVTPSVVPELCKPTGGGGVLMFNHIGEASAIDFLPCIALSNNDSHLVSASGGNISLFDMTTPKYTSKFLPPLPVATFLAFHPQDSNVIAIGMADSSIHVYNAGVDEVKTILEGHQKRITGLSFSSVLNVLVSSCADSQLCVWNTNLWEKQTTTRLQIPAGCVAGTCVQFHQDQTHLLAVHKTHIAIFEAPKLECPNQWFPTEASDGLITHATYSCDGRFIYVVFGSGSVGILVSSTLTLRCRISSTAFLPSNPKIGVRPLVIAAHPSEPTQFALGLSDGGVYVVEPFETDGKWCGSKEKVETVTKFQTIVSNKIKEERETMAENTDSSSVCRLLIPGVTVFKTLPEKDPITRLYSSARWLESEKLFSCTLSLVSRPEDYAIQFEDPNTGEIFWRGYMKVNDVRIATSSAERGHCFVIVAHMDDQPHLIALEIKGDDEAYKFHDMVTNYGSSGNGFEEEEVKIQKDSVSNLNGRKEAMGQDGSGGADAQGGAVAQETGEEMNDSIGKDDEFKHVPLELSELVKKLIADSTRCEDMRIKELEENNRLLNQNFLDLKSQYGKANKIEAELKERNSNRREGIHMKTLQIEQIERVVQKIIRTSDAAIYPIKNTPDETIGKWETSKSDVKRAMEGTLNYTSHSKRSTMDIGTHARVTDPNMYMVLRSQTKRRREDEGT